MTDALTINEMFHSIQGEGSRAGLPCVFVRLTGCHLRCGYCDTAYAFYEGRKRTIDDIVAEVDRYRCDLVQITGGEPLLQPNVHRLMACLCDAGNTVLIETSGASDITPCDSRVIRILDLKTPGSGEVDRNLWTNIEQLNQQDEVKFVICDRDDYQWARSQIETHNLTDRVGSVLMSPVAAVAATDDITGASELPLRELAEWILQDRLHVRLQTQLHKWIWEPHAQGI